jgi:hypothetical protein
MNSISTYSLVEKTSSSYKKLSLDNFAISNQPMRKRNPKLVDVKGALEQGLTLSQNNEPRKYLGSQSRAEWT